MEKQEEKDQTERLRRAIFVVILFLLIVYSIALTSALLIVFVWPRPPHALLTKLLVDHFGAIVGLPLMSVAAFVVVWAFRETEGQIEFELWGLKLRGASGPILLWVVTFMSISLALRVLW